MVHLQSGRWEQPAKGGPSGPTSGAAALLTFLTSLCTKLSSLA
jgi:hypothetical protein